MFQPGSMKMAQRSRPAGEKKQIFISHQLKYSMPTIPPFRSLVFCLTLCMMGLGQQAFCQAEKIEATPAPQVFVTVADLHVKNAGDMVEFKQAIETINEVIKPSFVYVTGDTPDWGTPEQYAAYKAVRDTIKAPVFDVVGDHELGNNGMATYRKTLGEPTYASEFGIYRILGLNSMGLDQTQTEWIKTELATAKEKKQTPMVFMHHDLAGLNKSVAGQLDKIFTDGGVKLVLTGHTHINSLINNGNRLDISTVSVRDPRSKQPKGFAIVTLDQGGIAWHSVLLEQKTIVAIANPVGKNMATGAEAVVKGKTIIRVKAYDQKGIKSVSASVAGGQPLDLKQSAAGTWSAEMDASSLKSGEQPLKVTATNIEGQSVSEEIVMQVSN
jgi:predicted phosphodiesterase